MLKPQKVDQWETGFWPGMRGLKKMAWEGDWQQTPHRRTSQLLDQIGPGGRFGENSNIKIVFLKVFEKFFFVMYLTIKGVPTLNSHISVVPKSSDMHFFYHEMILVRSQTFKTTYLAKIGRFGAVYMWNWYLLPVWRTTFNI